MEQSGSNKYVMIVYRGALIAIIIKELLGVRESGGRKGKARFAHYNAAILDDFWMITICAFIGRGMRRGLAEIPKGKEAKHEVIVK
jgi:hypothetical protein